jgi:Rrf2 family nitric oxide-sensitive transcriptional repressor
MQLTQFTDYSLRVLMFVGKERGRVCTMREIAAFYGISMEHLRKVIHKMARLGYLDSARGRGGGVTLGCAPDNIRIGELIVAMEEDLNIVNCEALACVLTRGCSLKLALNRASRAFIDSLNRTTLADLLGNRQLKRRFRGIDIMGQSAWRASRSADRQSDLPRPAVAIPSRRP